MTSFSKSTLLLFTFIVLTDVVSIGCNSQSDSFLSELAVLFYDDFDDGNLDGWKATSPDGDPGTRVDIVASPQGYAVRGVGRGYSQPGLDTWLMHPLKTSGLEEISLEIRAKSGSKWPSQASVFLIKKTGDAYRGIVWGEANKRVDFVANHKGVEEINWTHGIGRNAYRWHDYAWTRDANGWWSLYIDGSLEKKNFYQDNKLTSSNNVALFPLRNQAKIEWVRIRGR